MQKRSWTAVGAVLLWGAAAAAAHAEVKPAALFGDHMVLQEGMKIPVWGTADPGEAVTVTLGHEKAHARADAAGKWRVELSPLEGGSTARTMTITGQNTVTFSDVLVGEVWVCSGQSNMQFPISEDKDARALAQDNEPEIRIFLVPQATALEPQSEMKAAAPQTGGRQWVVCTAGPGSKKRACDGFSAVAYYFGRALHRATGKPVGLIDTYWGGTPAQAWTSLSGLEKDPQLQHYVNDYHHNVAHLAQATADYPAKMQAYRDQVKAWAAGPGQSFIQQARAWNVTAQADRAAGQLPPPPPVAPPGMPRQPATPDGGPQAPANLYNAMIAPLLPFAIKGAIWYQGEANAGRAAEYAVLFPRMITDWREKWGEGDFPFLWVQLAGFGVFGSKVPNWPYLREAQAKTLSLPKTGMATAIDVGNPQNIHPQDKGDVGERLALAARHVAYGEKLVYTGPTYASMKVEGGNVVVSFSHEGGGLVIAPAPWTPPGFAPLPSDHLVGFTVAGADKNFVPADAKIDGDTVVVSSAQVAAPVAVRYDWANAPQGNLYNKEGLPAFPFRTDDWIDPVAMGLNPVPPAK